MAMSGGGGESGGVMAEINVTPLVDVMLVLLIIFMITAPLMSHKIVIELPEATAQPNVEPPATITVSLKYSGETYWNDEPIARDAIQRQLGIEAKRVPQPPVQFRADKQTEYREVVKLMAAAKAAGMKKIGLITTPAR
ncbi:MAG TPA: biopolymer transporter ExbD [Xanthomonadales bacterium]|nr:biopolymer transporter ExbD [Xanthomonadales bacterium]